MDWEELTAEVDGDLAGGGGKLKRVSEDRQ